jgi:hypothetical protein
MDRLNSLDVMVVDIKDAFDSYEFKILKKFDLTLSHSNDHIEAKIKQSSKSGLYHFYFLHGERKIETVYSKKRDLFHKINLLRKHN